jgi:hypothetical protein
MHRNFRSSQWKKGLQHRADMLFTGIDCHDEIPSTVDGTHPLSVNSERAGEVAVRNERDQGLALFRRGCRVLRFAGLRFEFRVLRLCLIAGVGERQYIQASLL